MPALISMILRTSVSQCSTAPEVGAVFLILQPGEPFDSLSVQYESPMISFSLDSRSHTLSMVPYYKPHGIGLHQHKEEARER